VAPNQSPSGAIKAAIAAFEAGRPVCIHDAADREGETDLIYHADAIDPSAVARLRNDAGGLVCVALGNSVATAAELPYATAAIDHPAVEDTAMAYGDRPSFSLSVNHRETFTGITDEDRALTIQELGRFATEATVGDATVSDFAERFRAPGHVQLLRAAPGLLAERRGHTELGVALAKAADLSPAVVVCEMLTDCDGAQSRETARQYAAAHDIPFLRGEWLIETLA